MSHPLLLALFANRAAAAAAARDLHALGVARDDLSVVASRSSDQGAIADEVAEARGRRSRIRGRPATWASSAAYSGGDRDRDAGHRRACGGRAAGGGAGEAAGHAAGHLVVDARESGTVGKEAVDWQLRIQAGAVLLGVHARTIQPARRRGGAARARRRARRRTLSGDD